MNPITLVTASVVISSFIAYLLMKSALNKVELKLQQDKAMQEIKRVLQEASRDGEGVFILRKLDDSEYFFRVDEKQFFRRGTKI